MTNDKNNAFKGKVYYYSNINGQEHRIEKEFDNAHDMDQFVQNNKINQFSSLFPSFTYSPIWTIPSLEQWIDDVFDKKLSLAGPITSTDGLAQLRAEKARIEREEAEKEKKQSIFQKLIDEAKELQSFFEKRNDKEKVAEAQKQIDQYKKELQ